jgi:hypothetical protein
LNPKNLHRALSPQDDLDEIVTWRGARTVAHNLTLHYDRMMLILEPTPVTRALASKMVEVVNYPDGRFAVRHRGADLPFRVFDKIQTVEPGTIVDNKRLTAVLAQVQTQQAVYAPNRRRDHPARQRPPNNLEAPSASRSASPEMMTSALPFTASSRNLLSSGSRQAATRSAIGTSSAAASVRRTWSKTARSTFGAMRGLLPPL